MTHFGRDPTTDEEVAAGPRWGRLVLLPIGTVLVASGCTAAVSFAFRGRVAVVFVGLASFVIGYRTLQRAQYGPRSTPTREGGSIDRSRRDDVPRFLFIGGRYALQAVGVLAMALGVTAFAQTVSTPTPADAVVAGLYSVAGYVCTHVAVNFELL